MNHPSRPKFQQAVIAVLLLATAIASGIMLGWLLSTDVAIRVAQSPRSVSAYASPNPSATRSPTLTATMPLAAASRPTTVASPSLSAVATDAPTLTPAIAATHETAPVLFQQLIAAETSLRSGELEAVIDYGNDSRSVAQVRFDLGTAQILPRLDFKTAYQGSSSTQTIEEITIGDHAWERHGEQSWTSVPAREGMWDQIRFFLPGAEYGSTPSYGKQPDQTELRWYDATRDADVRVIVDPKTAVPLVLERQTRGTGLTLTVTYKGWNTPVEILPPLEGVQ